MFPVPNIAASWVVLEFFLVLFNNICLALNRQKPPPNAGKSLLMDEITRCIRPSQVVDICILAGLPGL